EGRPRPVLERDAIKPQRNRDATDEGGVVLADQEHGLASPFTRHGRAWPSKGRRRFHSHARPSTALLLKRGKNVDHRDKTADDSLCAAKSSLNHRHMPRDMTRRRPVEARIVRHLDLPPERSKARALIERQRGGVIEGAGMHPD